MLNLVTKKNKRRFKNMLQNLPQPVVAGIKIMKKAINKLLDYKEPVFNALAATPGFGKTLALCSVIAERFNGSSEGGCLVVVERLESGDEIKERIDKIAGKEICFFIEGPKRGLCFKDEKMAKEKLSVEDVAKCAGCPISYEDCVASPEKNELAKEYPVVIITHQRLSIYLRNTRKGALDKVLYESEYNRDVVFIDECPNTYDMRAITRKELNQLKYDERLYKKTNQQQRKRRLFKMVSHLEQEFNIYGNGGVLKPAETYLDLDKNRPTWHMAKLVQALYNSGGVKDIRTKRRDDGSEDSYVASMGLAIDNSSRLRNLARKVIILDGTANINPFYKKANVDVEVFSREEPLCNIHLLKNSRYKNSMRKDGIEEKIKKELESVHMKHPNKIILVITTKSFKKTIKAMGLDYVKTVHYMALKGRNDLRKYSVVYFTHLFQKPPVYYRSFWHAHNFSKKHKPILNFKFVRRKTGNRSFGFSRRSLEVIRVKGIVDYFIQDVYRTRIRNNEEGVDAYIGINDMLIATTILRFLPNANLIREKF